MKLKVGVCKVYYAKDGVLGSVMKFGICKMRVNAQEGNLVDGQFDRVW